MERSYSKRIKPDNIKIPEGFIQMSKNDINSFVYGAKKRIIFETTNKTSNYLINPENLFLRHSIPPQRRAPANRKVRQLPGSFRTRYPGPLSAFRAIPQGKVTETNYRLPNDEQEIEDRIPSPSGNRTDRRLH